MKNKALSILLVALWSLTATVAKANPVDMQMAREVGAKFVNANTAMKVTPEGDLQWVATYSISRGDAAFHVFNTPKGFVIVAADDCATPILGYSDEGHFDPNNVPIQMEEYLQGFVEQIQYGIEHRLAADEATARQWELVQATGFLKEQRATTVVAPLLTDTWNQDCYYNNLCPVDANGPCGHVYAGCTGTSMGQIMHFWGYPSSGTGSVTYTPSGYPQQSVNFAETTYEWANMPNSLSSSSGSTQINAVATLLWHCGVALQASYGAYGTSAYPSWVPNVMTSYFGYSSDLYGANKSSYSNDTWLSMVKGCLDSGRPIHYSGWNSSGGGGHSFVCDGYDSNDKLHFNWGWSGYGNGYFALGAMIVGGDDFSYSNYAVFDIHPNCYSGTYYQITASANPSVGGSVSGAGSHACGSVCTLTASPNSGYTFCSWTENGVVVSTEPTYSFTVMENKSLVANFIQAQGDECALVFYLEDSYGDGWNGNALTVSYSAGCFDNEQLTIESGSSATIVRDVVNGSHIVLGWVMGSWTYECSFTVSYYDSGTVIYQGSNLSSGFSYEFDVNCGGSTTYYDITATANPNNGGTVTGGGTYADGQSCTLTATANTGYTFINWTKNGSVVSTNPTYSFTVTEASAFVANFGLNSYTISATANPNAGGTITGAGTYDHGATCTLTATANTGYTFINWTQGGSIVSTNPTYSFTVTEASAFVANFGLNSYTISATANPNAGGTITGAGTYDHGATCTLTATANTGYTFFNWTQNGTEVSTDPSFSFTVTENAAYVANFTYEQYLISVAAIPTLGGTASGGGGFTYGQTCTLTATPNGGYSFVKWTCNGATVSTNAVYSFTVTQSNHYVAHFTSGSDVTQTTDFAAGWTWWSTYIDAGDVLTQLESGLTPNGQTIKSKSKSRVYRNGNWMGGLTAIEAEGSYRVQTAAACTVDITGAAATTPSAHPITLTPGWTWIGYPSTATMTVTEALANLTPTQGDVIKSKNKTAVYRNGAWMSSFTITPGTGLMYKSNAEGNVTLTYPSSAKGEAAVEETDNLHWTPNASAYPSNMTVIAVVELDGAELVTEATEGYELAAFADGECRGSFRLMPVEGRCMAILTIAGDETAGLRFALYDAATGEERLSETTVAYSTDAVVGDIDAPYVVRFRSAGVDEWENAVNVYPNPVGRGQKVSLGLGAGTTGKVQVEIVNALGVVVETRRITSAQTEITAPSVAGIYTLRITMEGQGTCIKKLVVK